MTRIVCRRRGMHAFTQTEVVIVGIYFTSFTISQPASPARKKAPRPHSKVTAERGRQRKQ